MSHIRVPQNKHKKVLLLIDVQNSFMKTWKKEFLKNLNDLIFENNYQFYINVSFEAKKGSLWDKQIKWIFPYEPTIVELKELLKDKPVIEVIKETRSAFKANVDISEILKNKKIKEVHIVGFDTNDCVYASAQASFDEGFFTYVIEECTGASGGKEIQKYAIKMLRHLNLTNHSNL
jgi:nicotinamidase-related amidase